MKKIHPIVEAQVFTGVGLPLFVIVISEPGVAWHDMLVPMFASFALYRGVQVWHRQPKSEKDRYTKFFPYDIVIFAPVWDF